MIDHGKEAAEARLREARDELIETKHKLIETKHKLEAYRVLVEILQEFERLTVKLDELGQSSSLALIALRQLRISIVAAEAQLEAEERAAGPRP